MAIAGAFVSGACAVLCIACFARYRDTNDREYAYLSMINGVMAIANMVAVLT